MLAEFLFGSPDRLVRLDMSEFQTGTAWSACSPTRARTQRPRRSSRPCARSRSRWCCSTSSRRRTEPLERVPPALRRRPADRSPGRTADFRQCVVILTSNLGAALESGSSTRLRPGARDPVPSSGCRAGAFPCLPARAAEPDRPDRGLPAVRARADASPARTRAPHVLERRGFRSGRGPSSGTSLRSTSCWRRGSAPSWARDRSSAPSSAPARAAGGAIVARSSPRAISSSSSRRETTDSTCCSSTPMPMTMTKSRPHPRRPRISGWSASSSCPAAVRQRWSS